MRENGDVLTADRALGFGTDPLLQRRFRRARAQKSADGASLWRETDYARGAGTVFPVLRFWPGLYDRFSADRVQIERQDFASVATPWEREHSPVLHPEKRSKLTAVVDGAHGWIVGYVLTESAAALTYDDRPLAPPRAVEDVFRYVRGYDIGNLTRYQSRFAARILLDVDGRFVSLLGLRDVKSHRTVADWVLSSDVVLRFDTGPLIVRSRGALGAKNGATEAPEVDASQVERARRVLQSFLEKAGTTPTAAADVDVLGYRGGVSTLCARSGEGARNGHRRRVGVPAETKVLEQIERGLPPSAQGTVYLASTGAVSGAGATAIFAFLGRNPLLRVILFAPVDAPPTVNTLIASVK